MFPPCPPGAALGGSLLGSIALLALARRPNKGEPVLAGYFPSALAIDAARAMAIWAAAFVGLLPLGALITAGLAASRVARMRGSTDACLAGPAPPRSR